MPKRLNNYAQTQQDCRRVSPPEDDGIPVPGVGEEQKEDIAKGHDGNVAEKSGEDFNQAAPEHDKCNRTLQRERDKPQDC
jgi:hypothetical protein